MSWPLLDFGGGSCRCGEPKQFKVSPVRVSWCGDTHRGVRAVNHELPHSKVSARMARLDFGLGRQLKFADRLLDLVVHLSCFGVAVGPPDEKPPFLLLDDCCGQRKRPGVRSALPISRHPTYSPITSGNSSRGLTRWKPRAGFSRLASVLPGAWL